jgi:hypothetical protein
MNDDVDDVEQSAEYLTGETNYWECRFVHHKSHLSSNPLGLGGKLATNRLSYVTPKTPLLCVLI